MKKTVTLIAAFCLAASFSISASDTGFMNGSTGLDISLAKHYTSGETNTDGGVMEIVSYCSGNGFASPERYPMIVENLREELPIAKAAGILPGDTIVAINGTSTPTLEESFNELAKYRDADISIDVKRGNEIRSFALHTDTAAQIGIFIKLGADKIYQTEHIEYSFFASFPAGITKGINTLKGYVNDMKYVFTKEGASTLGGFGAIGNLFPAEWDWQSFWTMTAFLSIILGFMNILPIPALDGGHVMFTLYEIITRRKPSDKFLEYAQIVGMTILFALLIYANGNDLYRFFIK